MTRTALGTWFAVILLVATSAGASGSQDFRFERSSDAVWAVAPDGHEVWRRALNTTSLERPDEHLLLARMKLVDIPLSDQPEQLHGLADLCGPKSLETMALVRLAPDSGRTLWVSPIWRAAWPQEAVEVVPWRGRIHRVSGGYVLAIDEETGIVVDRHWVADLVVAMQAVGDHLELRVRSPRWGLMHSAGDDNDEWTFRLDAAGLTPVVVSGSQLINQLTAMREGGQVCLRFSSLGAPGTISSFLGLRAINTRTPTAAENGNFSGIDLERVARLYEWSAEHDPTNPFHLLYGGLARHSLGQTSLAETLLAQAIGSGDLLPAEAMSWMARDLERLSLTSWSDRVCESLFERYHLANRAPALHANLLTSLIQFQIGGRTAKLRFRTGDVERALMLWRLNRRIYPVLHEGDLTHSELLTGWYQRHGREGEAAAEEERVGSLKDDPFLIENARASLGWWLRFGFSILLVSLVLHVLVRLAVDGRGALRPLLIAALFVLALWLANGDSRGNAAGVVVAVAAITLACTHRLSLRSERLIVAGSLVTAFLSLVMGDAAQFDDGFARLYRAAVFVLLGAHLALPLRLAALVAEDGPSARSTSQSPRVPTLLALLAAVVVAAVGWWAVATRLSFQEWIQGRPDPTLGVLVAALCALIGLAFRRGHRLPAASIHRLLLVLLVAPSLVLSYLVTWSATAAFISEHAEVWPGPVPSALLAVSCLVPALALALQLTVGRSDSRALRPIAYASIATSLLFLIALGGAIWNAYWSPRRPFDLVLLGNPAHPKYGWVMKQASRKPGSLLTLAAPRGYAHLHAAAQLGLGLHHHLRDEQDSARRAYADCANDAACATNLALLDCSSIADPAACLVPRLTAASLVPGNTATALYDLGVLGDADSAAKARDLAPYLFELEHGDDRLLLARPNDLDAARVEFLDDANYTHFLATSLRILFIIALDAEGDT